MLCRCLMPCLLEIGGDGVQRASCWLDQHAPSRGQLTNDRAIPFLVATPPSSPWELLPFLATCFMDMPPAPAPVRRSFHLEVVQGRLKRSLKGAFIPAEASYRLPDRPRLRT